MKIILTKMICMMMCVTLILSFAACSGEDKGETEPQEISLSLSTDENDIEYMQASSLSVFGLDKAENCTLELTFSESENTEDGFAVSGRGILTLNGEAHDFDIDNQMLQRIEVSEDNTVYSGIIDSSVGMEKGEKLEISIDLTAGEDFSQAVATVSSGGGYLFFGDVFDDYLEYFYMVLSQMTQDEQNVQDEQE